MMQKAETWLPRPVALAFVIMWVFSIAWAGAARAQQTFDLNAYKALVDASSSETVPVGTHMTVHNWEKYRNFFGIGEQALYSGKYSFHVGDSPDYEVVVGPKSTFKEPSQLIHDTEKYSSQVRLVPTPGGSYTIDGWVAGWPFPNPQEPQLAYKIYYDAWASFIPGIYFFKSAGDNGDRYYNHHATWVDLANYRLTHRSDPGQPVDFPGMQGLLQTQYIEVLLPEESKYTVSLTMQHDDPNKLAEIYAFLPSLRRSLRLSTAARCAPILGSDYLNDDNNNGVAVLPADFHMTYLGRKKILAIVNGPSSLHASRDLIDSSQTQHAPLGGWPVTSKFGSWEVRNADLIRITPIVERVGPGYCYGEVVIYLDSDFHQPLTRETYDNAGKLWKVQVIPYIPADVYDGHMNLNSYSSVGSIIDMQNLHYTVAPLYDNVIGMDKVPAKYRDIAVMATPKGLAQVMQ